MEKEAAEDPRDELIDEIVHKHDRSIIDRDEEEKFLFFWMALI